MKRNNRPSVKRACQSAEPGAFVGRAALGIVVVHLGFLLLRFAIGPDVIPALEMRPDAAFLHLQLWRLITGIFVFSQEIWPVLWLVVFVGIFGREVERQEGSAGFIFFYLLAGVFVCMVWGIGSIWNAIAYNIPSSAWHTPLRTSGAVSALFALFFLRTPRRSLRIARVVPAPGWSLVLLFFVLDYRFFSADRWSLTLPAHFAGALFSLLFEQFDWRWSRLRSWWHRPSAAAPSEVLPATQRRPAMPEPVSLQYLESKVDEILAKIAQNGMDSLSPNERSLLEQASARYKSRRSS